MNADLAKQYAAVGKKYANQQDFRMKWAKTELDKHITEKAHTTKQTTRAEEYGRYKPFSVMWRDEGHDHAGLVASLNIVKNYIRLTNANKLLNDQHPWFKYNRLSERIEFLHLESRFSSLVDESWCFQEKWTSDGAQVAGKKALVDGKQTPEKTTLLALASSSSQAGAAGAAHAGAPGAKPVLEAEAAEQGELAKPPGKEGRKRGVLGAADGNLASPRDSKIAKRLSHVDQTLQEISKVKKKFQTAMQSAENIENLIKNDTQWSYFNNDAFCVDLREVSWIVENNAHLLTTVWFKFNLRSWFMCFDLFRCPFSGSEQSGQV